MKKLAAALSLGLLISAPGFAVTPGAKAGNVLDNGLSLNGISLNGISVNGLRSDGLVAGMTSGELNGVAVQAVILPAATR